MWMYLTWRWQDSIWFFGHCDCLLDLWGVPTKCTGLLPQLLDQLQGEGAPCALISTNNVKLKIYRCFQQIHNVELRVVQNEVTGTWFMDLTHYSLILHKLDGHYIYYLKKIILNLWGSHLRNKLLFICENNLIVWLTHWWWRTWTLDRAQADS